MTDIVPYLALTAFLSITVFLLKYGSAVKYLGYDLRPLIIYTVAVLSCLIAFFYGFRFVDRFHGGVDTRAYLEIFNSLDTSDWNTFFNQRVEKGYILMMWVVKSIGLSFAHFMMLFYLILCCLFYKISLHLTRNWTVIFSILLLSVTFLESFNISRMSLGALLFFYAFINISYGKLYKAILYSFLAVSIQVTFIWGGLVLVYYVLLSKINRKYIVFFHFLFLFCSFIAVEVFKEILSIVGYLYYLQENDIEPSYLNYIFVLILLIINFLFLRGKVNNPISKNIFLILPSMLFIMPLYSALPIAYRFNYIYYPMIAFIIPDIYCASMKLKNGIVVGMLISFIPMLYVILKYYGYITSDIEYLLIWDVRF